MVLRLSLTWISCVFFLLTVAADFDVKVVPPTARLKEWKAGENLLMSCNVTGEIDTVPAFTWSKDGTALGAENGRIKTVLMPDERSMRLMIMKPVAADAGSYVCKVTVGDEVKETTVEVTIIVAPSFVDAPFEQHPQEDTDAEILCRVDATPAATLVWQRNGQTLNKDHQRGYSFEENDQVLVIPNFRAEEDDGIYSCLAFQEPNMDSREINVTGYSSPKITLFSKAEEQGYEGQPLQLICQGIGKPAPEYKWYKGTPEDKDATPLEPTDKYAFPDPGTLEIQALIEDDAGSYTCVASNDVAETRNATHIKVFRKPKIAEMKNVTATQGMKVELVCTYEGDGEITAKWMFKGETIEPESSDNDAISQHVNDQEDNADDDPYDEQYASNGVDEDSNNVVKKKRHARSGRFARHADTTEDEESAEMRKHIAVTEGDHSLTLTLVDVRLDDAAEYQCEATNEAGTDNRRVFLAITHAPSMVRKTDETVRSYTGHAASFFCEVSAVPAPKWTWTKPDKSAVVVDSEHYFIETTENGLKSSLKLKTSQPGDYGTYKCSAENGIGAPVEGEVYVLEVVAPPVPQGLIFDGEHPNFATISIEDFEDLSESQKPTDIVLFYATAAQVAAEDFDWNECETATLRYGEHFELPNLIPSTEYRIRARSKNEAGESEMSSYFTYTTSSPIAPATPEFTRDSDDANAECDTVCEIKWAEPNNHGADIIRYELKATPVELRDDGTYNPIGPVISTEITDGQLQEELDGLMPNTYYDIQLVAVNDIGASEPAQMIIHTSDQMRSASGLSVGAIVGIVALVLLVLLIIVDIACYIINRCGVLACICVNCCGQTPSERKSKEMTMEEGAKPESAQLLTASKTTEVTVSTETNGNGTTNGNGHHHQPKSHKATTV